MNKPTLNILVNPNVNVDSYLSFLSEKYNVHVTKYSVDEVVDISKINLVLFTGGEDVTPKYYNEKQGKYTSINEKRDTFERAMYNRCINIPKLGICRGSQFLTVMSGGKLIQHVEGHRESHDVTFNINNTYLPTELKNFKVTSTHHQMMFPYVLNKEDYKILAYSTHYLSNTYLNGSNSEIYIDNIDFYECEIVRYYQSKSLCIQGHPEFKGASDEFKTVTHYLIQSIL